MDLKRKVVVGLFVLTGLLVVPASASALTFQPSPGSPITFGTGPTDNDAQINGIAVGDVDGNGNADIISVGNSNKINVSLANNEGDGFAPAPGSPFGTGSSATSRFQVLIGDFGGDSATDLVIVSISNFSTRRFETYIGNDSGVFPANPDFILNAATTPSPQGQIIERGGSSVGLVNNDSYPDIVTGMGDHSYMVALGTATGQFNLTGASPVSIPTFGNDPLDQFASTAIGDWDNDGFPDIALVLDYIGGPIDPQTLPGIYQAFGNGDGTFTAGSPAIQQNLPITSIRTIDLGGDDFDDVSYTIPNADHVATLVGSASGLDANPSAHPFVDVGTGKYPFSQTVADMDGDTQQDVVSANFAGHSLSVANGDGTGGIILDPGSPFALPSLGGLNFVPEGVEAGDFNGDGFPDLAARSSGPTQDRARAIDVLISKPTPIVAPNSLDFPVTATGQSSAPIDVNVSNDGAPPLRFDDLNITGTGADQFSVNDSDCPSSLDSGEDCDLHVTFEPTIAGDYHTELQIGFLDGVGISQVSLSGATSAHAQVDPTTLAFPDATSGYAPDAKTLEVTINSNGGIPLDLGNPVITGVDAGNFSIVDPHNCDAPLDPGFNCTIHVKFAPVMDIGGFLEGQLNFQTTNDPTISEVQLEGHALRAQYTVTPASRNFGSTEIGSGAGATEDFAVTSTGTAMLPINGASLTGPDAGSFAIISNNCAPAIQPQEVCGVKVKFDPKSGSAGPRTATLVVDAFSSVIPGPKSIPLSGTATSPVPPGKPALSLKLKSAGKVKRGKTLVVSATVKNTGMATAKSIVLKTTVPGKLAKKPKAIKVSSLAAGKSVTKKIKIKVKKSAKKGKKLKVKVAASASGVSKKTATRTAKIK